MPKRLHKQAGTMCFIAGAVKFPDAHAPETVPEWDPGARGLAASLHGHLA